MSNLSYRKLKEIFFHRIVRRFKLIPQKNFDSKKLIFANNCKMVLFGIEDVISDNIAFLSYYEWELSEIIKKLSFNSSIMVDAGANMGYFSLIFLSNSLKGKLFAFEPNPSVSFLLDKNMVQNNFTERAVIIKKALSATAENIPFNFGSSDKQSGWGHVDNNSPTYVEATTLDLNFLNEEIIDILKIDVEGFEFEVLKGAKKLLSDKRIRNIFFEINDGMLQTNGISGETVIGYLNKFEYSVEKVTNEIMWAKPK
ncbi:MAG: FkbM family methyltransferase [Sphingobacteriia bacterium]|jgi:FkbM family methyltransferase